MNFKEMLFSGLLTSKEVATIAQYMMSKRPDLFLNLDIEALEAVGCRYYQLTQDQQMDILSYASGAYYHRLKIQSATSLDELVTQTIH